MGHILLKIIVAKIDQESLSKSFHGQGGPSLKFSVKLEQTIKKRDILLLQIEDLWSLKDIYNLIVRDAKIRS